MNCNKIIYDKDCNIIIQEDFDQNYVYVYILQLNRTTGLDSETIIKTKEDCNVIFEFKEDGFYTLLTIKVPTNPLMPYYYKNGSFYKNITEVELEELIETNPEISKLDITYDYYFKTCQLKKCYIDICYNIFDQETSLNCGYSNKNKDIIYKRDLLLSAINVITYLAEMEQFEEAERLLERIIGCNGLCKQQENNCGCGK